jgi:hypothetical protein
MTKFKKTKRSFYGKWLYKISLAMEGCSVIRDRTPDQLKRYFSEYENRNLNTFSLPYKALGNKEEILSIAVFLNLLPKEMYAFRCERSILDIYINDANIFKEIIEKYKHILRFAFEPEANNIEVLQNKKNIVVKKYPHERFKFKVFLLPHKVKDLEQKHEFLNWCENQGDKITLSVAVKDWFIQTNWNWDRRYVLVEDEKTLLMMKLKNSEALGSIYDYVISDK